MNRLILFLLILFLLISCTPAPRYHYRGEPEKSRAEKNKTENREIVKKNQAKKEDQAPLLSFSTGDSAILTSSYYGGKFHGRRTSNGEIFNMYGYSAAHKELPFGTVLKVTYLQTGKSVLVTVNDRGPFIAGRDLDLSYMAAKKIGLAKDGVGKVKIRIVKWGGE